MIEVQSEQPADTDHFRKSSYSGAAGCVQIAFAANGAVLLRDSKAPLAATLTFTRDEWVAFLAGVHNGEFEPPALA